MDDNDKSLNQNFDKQLYEIDCKFYNDYYENFIKELSNKLFINTRLDYKQLQYRMYFTGLHSILRNYIEEEINIHV